MALVGGGTSGAGNTVNPAGTSTSLNYIGDHAYWSPGAFEASTTEATMGDFTTGGHYIVGNHVV